MTQFYSYEDFKESVKTASIAESIEEAFSGDLYNEAELDLDVGSGEDSSIDFINAQDRTGFDSVELDSPVRAIDEELVANQVEAYLVGLIQDGKRAHLISLFGDGKGHSANSYNKFKTDYVSAIKYNPVLKWYGRLARTFSPDQFFVGNDELTLKAPEASLKKVLKAFDGNYGEADSSSPIIAVMESIKSRIALNKNQISSKHFSKDLVRHKGDVDLEVTIDPQITMGAVKIAQVEDKRVLKKARLAWALKYKSASGNAADKAYKVESYLVSLLNKGHRSRALALLGESSEDITASFDSDSMDSFKADYGVALSHNPALKWYGKLAGMFGPKQFGVVGNQLYLNAPVASLRTALEHFNGDFTGMDEYSPIVSVLKDAFEQVENSSLRVDDTTVTDVPSAHPKVHPEAPEDVESALDTTEDNDYQFGQGSRICMRIEKYIRKMIMLQMYFL